jgi:hypothetical protein
MSADFAEINIMRRLRKLTQIIYPQISQIIADYYLKIMPSAFMALKSS